ncbi:MAG: hypothetical protein IT453_00035 [Planctomycetes bacterium]|nr:hypothetical protein [Planctomycetota bacterium]
MKLLVWILMAAFSPLSAAQQAPVVAKPRSEVKLTVERTEIWRGLADFQRRLAEHGAFVESSRMIAVHRGVDAAMRPWWYGFGEADLGKLAELTRSLRKTPEPEAETVARSLRVLPNPLVAIVGGNAVELSVDSQFPARWSGAQSLELVVRATAPNGATLESKSFRVDPGEKLDVHTKVEFPPIPKPTPDDAKATPPIQPGVWRLELVARGTDAEPVALGNAWIVDSSLDLLRQANEAKLKELEPKIAERRNVSLTEAFAVLRARNALLSDAPSRQDSAQFALDPVAHAAAITEEMAKLERGLDPYRLRVGDLWRTLPVRQEEKAVAVHLYAPANAALAKPMPLVIVLGSMGSDENTLFDLMVPRLRQLADQKGCLVVALRTSRDMMNDRRYDALFSELSDDYPIDSKRVYFIGHAAGAAQLGALLAQRGERIAGFVSLGASDIKFPASRHVPTIVVAGGADELDGSEKMDKKSARYRSTTSAVDFKAIDNVGWYLLPDKALEFGVDWLFQRTLE